MFSKLLIFVLFSFVASNSIDENYKTISVDLPVRPAGKISRFIEERDKRIVGGYPAEDTEFTSVFVLARINFNDWSYYLCNGAFITTSWGITALRCVQM